MIRILANFAISMFWIWVFSLLGWVTLDKDLHPVAVLVAIAAISLVIDALFTGVYMLFLTFSCGIGCVTFPIYFFGVGWITLLAVAHLTSLMTINVDFWFTGLVMSFAFGIIRLRFSLTSEEKTSTTTDIYRVNSSW